MAEEQKEVKVGVVAHYFTKVGVGIIKLTDGDIKVGDSIHIKGHTTDFTQPVESMQLEHKDVDRAGKGDHVGIKVVEHAREHDIIYKVVEE